MLVEPGELEVNEGQFEQPLPVSEYVSVGHAKQSGPTSCWPAQQLSQRVSTVDSSLIHTVAKCFQCLSPTGRGRCLTFLWSPDPGIESLSHTSRTARQELSAVSPRISNSRSCHHSIDSHSTMTDRSTLRMAQSEVGGDGGEIRLHCHHCIKYAHRARQQRPEPLAGRSAQLAIIGASPCTWPRVAAARCQTRRSDIQIVRLCDSCAFWAQMPRLWHHCLALLALSSVTAIQVRGIPSLQRRLAIATVACSASISNSFLLAAGPSTIMCTELRLCHQHLSEQV